MELLSVNNVGLAVLSILVLSIAVALRRWYASSINNIPGPFWASFPIFWEVSEIIKGHIQDTMIALHETHGRFIEAR